MVNKEIVEQSDLMSYLLPDCCTVCSKKLTVVCVVVDLHARTTYA